MRLALRITWHATWNVSQIWTNLSHPIAAAGDVRLRFDCG